MHNPYVVGRWVRGDEHYDRQSLIEMLLTIQDTAIWVVGTRRMGKTSLLRQVEWVTAQPDSRFAPLFWDLQGGATPEELTRELCWALEADAARFRTATLDVGALCAETDAATILRKLSRAMQQEGRQLLLLVDEAEGFLRVGEQDPNWLARLRKVLQEGTLRTIMASTRQLTQLIEQSADWVTSPFLFGFRMVILWPLKREGAAALVRQLQSAWRVEVDEPLLEQILDACHHHPYLIQLLCARLFSVDANERRYLRAIQDEDLAVDHQVAAYFSFDYQRLSELEQRLLSVVAEQEEATEQELVAAVVPAPEARVTAALRSLHELGHLRRTPGGWRVGSEFMRRWLAAQRDERSAPEARPPVDAPITTVIPETASTGRALDLNEVETVARTLGIAPERIHALAERRIRSEREFFHAVRNIFFEVRHLVEQDEGYRVLVTQDAQGEPILRSEEEIQIALKHWLRPMCRALNINFDRETHTGRGLLDFKFSIGHDFRCLVEVKLFHNARLLEGVAIQLPTYLLAEQATYGIYVPIFLDSAPMELHLRELHAWALQRARSHGVVIDVIDIRAWRPRSASKVESLEDADRYALRGPLGLRALSEVDDADAEPSSLPNQPGLRRTRRKPATGEKRSAD